MPRSTAPLFNLVQNSVILSYTHTSSVIRDPRYGNIIHLLQLLILNEYAARCAVACHYLGLVDVDD